MTEKRFTIDVLDENNWLIQDTKTGENANPIDGTTNVLKGLISTLNKFNDENEQLKSTIKEVTELLSDEVDLFSDKATEHDINAYIELKEFDNKDAFYMATATKKAIKMLKEL